MGQYRVTTDQGTFMVTTDEPPAIPGMEKLGGAAPSSHPGIPPISNPEDPQTVKSRYKRFDVPAAAMSMALTPASLPATAGAIVGSYGAQRGAAAMGASPEVQDIAGLAGGAAGGGLGSLSPRGVSGAVRGGYEAAKEIPLVGKVLKIPEAVLKGYRAGSAPAGSGYSSTAGTIQDPNFVPPTPPPAAPRSEPFWKQAQQPEPTDFSSRLKALEQRTRDYSPINDEPDMEALPPDLEAQLKESIATRLGKAVVAQQSPPVNPSIRVRRR